MTLGLLLARCRRPMRPVGLDAHHSAAARDTVALGLLDGHAHTCVIGAEPDQRDARTDELMAAVRRLLPRDDARHPPSIRPPRASSTETHHRLHRSPRTLGSARARTPPHEVRPVSKADSVWRELPLWTDELREQ